jgi:hypothetical protein
MGVKEAIMRIVRIVLIGLVLGTMGLLFPAANTIRTSGNFKGSVTGGGAVAAVTGWYLTAGIGLVYQPRLLGIGGEEKFFYGLQMGDAYLLTLAVAKVGWIEIGGGVSAMVRRPTTTSLYNNNFLKLYPALTAGLVGPLIPVGPGRLGFDLSLDTFLSAVPPSALTGAGTNIAAALFVPTFATVLGAVKLTAGLDYMEETEGAAKTVDSTMIGRVGNVKFRSVRRGANTITAAPKGTAPRQSMSFFLAYTTVTEVDFISGTIVRSVLKGTSNAYRTGGTLLSGSESSLDFTAEYVRSNAGNERIFRNSQESRVTW